MNRQEVITALESLANGSDPSTGSRIPHESFHVAEFTSAGTPWSAEEDARLGHEFE